MRLVGRIAVMLPTEEKSREGSVALVVLMVRRYLGYRGNHRSAVVECRSLHAVNASDGEVEGGGRKALLLWMRQAPTV